MNTASFILDLGVSGLVLKAALVSEGVIHATFRDVATGFFDDGQGGYEFISEEFPSDYRGVIVFYVGTLGAATDFDGVTIQSRGSVEPSQMTIVPPTAPTDLSLCRVYGYFETIDNLPAAGIEILFELVAPDPTASEKLISGRKVVVKTDAEGKIVDSIGRPYIELQRNDVLTPADTKYLVSSEVLRMDEVELLLETELFDLASIVT